MLFGFVGSSYTAKSSAVANEEAINLFVETLEANSGPIAPGKEYGGSSAQVRRNLFSTPGLLTFAALPEKPVRGQCIINGRLFAVGGSKLVELAGNGTQTVRATIATDGNPVSIVASSIQLLIVSAGKAYCYTLANNSILEVTGQLQGVPVFVEYSDSYFIVQLQGNKLQFSNPLDGTLWNAIFIDAVEVFPENIVSVIVNHREIWVFGSKHCQPYYNSGSANIFDVISGAFIEKGSAATFGPCRLDNSIFWVDEDDRGGRACWRSNGYTPVRVSTHAVEADLQSYASIAGLVTYAYQDGGHEFWVLYIPGAPWSWVYDVAEGLWHKRGSGWNGTTFQPHWSQNHTYAWGKHLVGDWNSANLYQMSDEFLDDNGSPLRWLRRSPTVEQEMQWITHAELTIDAEVGMSPKYPLVDGSGNPRPAQIMLRWSDNRGRTWSNEQLLDCGFAGNYNVRAIARRLGRSRYRVYEASGTDPVRWTLVEAYLRTA